MEDVLHEHPYRFILLCQNWLEFHTAGPLFDHGTARTGHCTLFSSLMRNGDPDNMTRPTA